MKGNISIPTYINDCGGMPILGYSKSVIPVGGILKGMIPIGGYVKGDIHNPG